MYLWVDDVDEVAAEFGVPVDDNPWGRDCQIVDPSGNRVRVGTALRAVRVIGRYGHGGRGRKGLALACRGCVMLDGRVPLLPDEGVTRDLERGRRDPACRRHGDRGFPRSHARRRHPWGGHPARCMTRSITARGRAMFHVKHSRLRPPSESWNRRMPASLGVFHVKHHQPPWRRHRRQRTMFHVKHLPMVGPTALRRSPAETMTHLSPKRLPRMPASGSPSADAPSKAGDDPSAHRRQPEGRRWQDDDDGQRRRCARPGWRPGPRHRS